MSAEYSVEVVETAAGFSAIGEDWNDLLGRCGTAPPFLTYDWVRTWWNMFGSGKSLYLLVARDVRGTVQGIAPLCRGRERRGGLPFTALRFVGWEKVGSDYLDFIAADNAGEAVTETLIAHLLQSPGAWDVAFFSDLLETAGTITLLQKEADRLGCNLAIQPRYSCPYLFLSENGTRKGRILNPRVASNLRRRMKQLAGRCRIDVEICTDPGVLEGRLETLFSFHRRRLGAASNFGRPEVRDFHRAMTAAFLNKGLLLFFTLLAAGRPIAIVYGVKYKGRFYSYQTSFDTDWKEYSPGAVLLGHCVEYAADRGMSEYDLLRGDEKYKSEWTELSRKTVTCMLGSRSLRGRFSCRYLLVYQKARTTARRILHGLGVVPKHAGEAAPVNDDA